MLQAALAGTLRLLMAIATPAHKNGNLTTTSQIEEN
jgi:hypothetical protein